MKFYDIWERQSFIENLVVRNEFFHERVIGIHVGFVVTRVNAH